MPAPQEAGLPIPHDVLFDKFSGSLMAMQDYLTGIQSDDPTGQESGQIAGEMYGPDMFANKVMMLVGSDRFDEDVKAATREAGFRRPWGIVANTLSPNVKVILYPQTVFEAAEEHVAMAAEEGIDVQTEGPQAMVYVLDGFVEEADDTPMVAANLAIFVPRLTRALTHGRFPLEQGETSAEFKKEVEDTFVAVRHFVDAAIPDRAGLSPTVARLVRASDTDLPTLALNYSAYQTELITPPGLVIPERTDITELTPQQAIARKQSYLHIDDRQLPKRPPEAKDIPSPKLPWTEYTVNRWNRDSELYGRYESELPTGEDDAASQRTLRVDYKLESLHFPGKYGFFNAIEITTVGPEGVDEHVILGQEIAAAGSVTGEEEKLHLDENDEVGMPLGVELFPVIVAGSFDFSNPRLRAQLEALVVDEATKREVKLPLRDALMLYDQGRLGNVIHMNDVEGGDNALNN
ncbi:hypothetical protein A3H78_00785 [Candidatus Roizmanbacteria bacterium RIFCSPLOWO2_02_FULL_36_11]|uniref:Uncharacterized protein n=1 Tax=Candidatus Roizmanbacteria bacterium RIFCSPLOWO2_02_FULL_36_11 TaxID=1802071 RepID=A0A1F7JHB9_9BACT|nr:MAG: hypothetical protein A3H78_00785 [Candidatus Roizmanbacteria bacterium RIFCSPLOWO2_02_FULL_36_11]